MDYDKDTGEEVGDICLNLSVWVYQPGRGDVDCPWCDHDGTLILYTIYKKRVDVVKSK